MVGGPGLASSIRSSDKAPHAPSGEALLHAVAKQDLPLNFFSYHMISACPKAECDVSKVGRPALLHRLSISFVCIVCQAHVMLLCLQKYWG